MSKTPSSEQNLLYRNILLYVNALAVKNSQYIGNVKGTCKMQVLFLYSVIKSFGRLSIFNTCKNGKGAKIIKSSERIVIM